ncbi:MAG TPA: hypothetical protein VGQ81_14370 [Acidobacteriota bacterium]|nr:hypothetical protein [Acidobacteriota bacterium]
MFSIGLEFSVKDLLQAKWVALIGGPTGILLSVALGLGIAPFHSEAAILARAHRPLEAESLVQAGATEVIQPEVEARTALIRRAFSHLRLPEDHASTYLEAFR